MDNAANITLLVYVTVFVLGQVIIGLMKLDSERTQVRRHLPILGLSLRITGAFIISMSLASTTMTPISLGLPTPLRVLGFGLVPVGLVLSLSSQWYLGKWWNFHAGLYASHRLITTGPYDRIRHPLYTGMLISFSGLAMAASNWPLVIGGACIVGSFLVSALQEERMLHERFKDQHREWRSRTGFVFPRLRRPKTQSNLAPQPPQAKSPVTQELRPSKPPEPREPKSPTNTARAEQARRKKGRRRDRRK